MGGKVRVAVLGWAVWVGFVWRVWWGGVYVIWDTAIMGCGEGRRVGQVRGCTV